MKNLTNLPYNITVHWFITWLNPNTWQEAQETEGQQTSKHYFFCGPRSYLSTKLNSFITKCSIIYIHINMNYSEPSINRSSSLWETRQIRVGGPGMCLQVVQKSRTFGCLDRLGVDIFLTLAVNSLWARIWKTKKRSQCPASTIRAMRCD